MKTVIIIYVIGIVTYWLGVLTLIFTAMKNWKDVDESLKEKARKRSKVSCSFILIALSLVPVVNFSMGIGYIYFSNSSYFLTK